MSKGILTNKTTGDALHVEVNTIHAMGAYYRIAGSSNGVVYFYNEDWTYAEEKPSVQDQFDAFPIGQVFVTDQYYDYGYGTGSYWIKVSNANALFVDPLWSKEAEKFSDAAYHYTELTPYTSEGN